MKFKGKGYTLGETPAVELWPEPVAMSKKLLPRYQAPKSTPKVRLFPLKIKKLISKNPEIDKVNGSSITISALPQIIKRDVIIKSKIESRIDYRLPPLIKPKSLKSIVASGDNERSKTFPQAAIDVSKECHEIWIPYRTIETTELTNNEMSAPAAESNLEKYLEEYVSVSYISNDKENMENDFDVRHPFYHDELEDDKSPAAEEFLNVQIKVELPDGKKIELSLNSNAPVSDIWSYIDLDLHDDRLTMKSIEDSENGHIYYELLGPWDSRTIDELESVNFVIK